jgi:predicted ribosome quality control (RQC) complex YloA/Tae2 family protein
MKIELFLDKPLEQSAAVYFEKAKKAKRKQEGARAALERSHKELLKLMDQKDLEERKLREEKSQKTRKLEWYEKFHWFISSEGFLCIGGRDSTTNEILVKKHTEKGDLVFHTKIEGSPFFIIKSENKKIGEATLQETAQATASYSKGWKLGMSSLETFYVEPEQLSKTAPQGEYITKGAFTVKGKMNLLQVKLELAIGITKDGQIIGGPVEAIKKNSEKYSILEQGREQAGAISKQLHRKLGGELDDMMRFIPTGGSKIKQ